MKTKTCYNCNITFDNKGPNRKYCSKRCAAIVNNSKFPKRKPCENVFVIRERKYKNDTIGKRLCYKKEYICKRCTKIYYTFTKSSSFCSNTCRSLNKRETVTLPLFFAGLITNEPTIRKLVKLTQEYKCVSCGVGETYNNLPIVLQVDHIDGNSDNNLPPNLRLLCPNCHSQTKSYSGRNKGSGRTRRKIYRNSLNDLRKAVTNSLP